MYGIYGIFNATKEKWYVGQSENVSDRLSQHKSHLKHGTHHCKEMQSDYSNGDNFVFMVLETEPKIKKNQLNDRENHYITKLSINGKYPGYNKIINTKSQGKAMRYICSSDRTVKEQPDYVSVNYYKELYEGYVSKYDSMVETNIKLVNSFNEQNKILTYYSDQYNKEYNKANMYYQLYRDEQLKFDNYRKLHPAFETQETLTNDLKFYKTLHSVANDQCTKWVGLYSKLQKSYNELKDSYNGLKKSHGELNNSYNELNKSYNELKDSYNKELKKPKSIFQKLFGKH